MSGSTTKAPFRLQDVRDAILNNQWVVYNPANDPGQLWVWGNSLEGRLGDNSGGIGKSSPVQIPGTQWLQVSIDRSHSGGRKSDGTLWMWGDNISGQIGDNTIVLRSSPVQIPGTQWTDISVGFRKTGALKSDGTLWTWGYNFLGQLGQNNTVYRSSPVQVPGTQWVEISIGSTIGAARKSDGTLWTWGDGSSGQLGTNNTVIRSSPVQVPGTQWTEVIVGGSQTTAGRKSDGTLWMWGFGYCGQLGNGVAGLNGIVSSPIQVPGTQWTEISTAGTHVGARKSDGTLWAWGRNNYGQLGTNDRVNRSSPIQIPGTQWAEISMVEDFFAGAFSLARKSDGSLWTWGYNSRGQLGQNDRVYRSSPVQVPGTQWLRIAGSAALKSN